MIQRETVTVMQDDRGNAVARLQLSDRAQPSIVVLDDETAAAHGEEPVQLLEGRPYDFVLLDCDRDLELEETELIQPNRLSRHSGRIEPGLSTGLLTIHLVDSASRRVARTSVEVRTYKLDYRTQYRRMLDDIAEASAALLLNIRGAAQARLQVAAHDPETLHQQFVIIRAMLSRRELTDAVARITGAPHRRWTTRAVEVDPRRALRLGPNLLGQIASRSNRVRVPDAHHLAGVLRSYGISQPSMPNHFSVLEQTEEVDTPENRFVKFALEDWEAFLLHLERLLSSSSAVDARLRREVEAVRTQVSAWLGHPFFADIGTLDLLPLGSPVLQRRSGYRDVLRAWTTFRLATSLSWDAGRDVFGGGKKDVAVLYEYWLFFKLLALVSGTFHLDTPPSSHLIEATGDGLDLRLKSGQHLSFKGTYEGGVEPMRVRFSYNRTFSVGAAYPDPGAWSRPMRPDYTLSVWPRDFSEDEAERQELIVHVHFDAKYRVEEIAGLFGRGKSDGVEAAAELDAEHQAFRAGTAPKRADLLKMHAYKDAIRRSEGAYVIFPGIDPTAAEETYAFSELLPGLGAFAVRPGAEKASLDLLQTFLQDVADFASDRSRRLDQQSYHTFRIQEPSGRYRTLTRLPDRDERGRRLRPCPPAES
jgi:predicted component of viral defense system (DUF524 family)